ncbi:hypothetical protein ACH5RR_022819 [Cinchona calisaya]|uniref:RRM domain-containing protein n=1 Tax=Cinchona calisaya TaxID=153742 RepID=A0ABD2ZC27_9GENT
MAENNDSCTVYVGNLDEKVKERVIYDILIQAGRLANLYIPKDKETDKPRGFAFAEYETEEAAEYAVKLFSGLVTLYNRTLKFSIAGQHQHKHLGRPNLLDHNRNESRTNSATLTSSIKPQKTKSAVACNQEKYLRKSGIVHRNPNHNFTRLATTCRVQKHQKVSYNEDCPNNVYNSHYYGNKSNYDYGRRVIRTAIMDHSINCSRLGRCVTGNSSSYYAPY